jgi:ribonuclease D
VNAGAGLPVIEVCDSGALAAAVEACRARAFVALDTEFMRVRTFYAQPALFQLCDGAACYLVDPLALPDLGPLAALLTDTRVTKLMHSCSEDLEVCERRLGALPEPLIDTQVMAAFCGLGLSVGYQRAIAEVLGISLEKSETRTDWLQRPLSPAQLHYAAEDVAHLGALHEALARRLEATPERRDWVREECAAVLARYRARDPEGDYRALGGAWKLDARALALLGALYAWREQTARARDLPRSWVLPDAALHRVAERQPCDAASLARIEDIPPAVFRRHGPALLDMVAAARALPADALPDPVAPPPGPAEARRVKQLREEVVATAGRLGIAPEMLARRRELEELLRCATTDGPAASLVPMRGWRRAVIGERLWAIARGEP